MLQAGPQVAHPVAHLDGLPGGQRLVDIVEQRQRIAGQFAHHQQHVAFQFHKLFVHGQLGPKQVIYRVVYLEQVIVTGNQRQQLLRFHLVRDMLYGPGELAAILLLKEVDVLDTPGTGIEYAAVIGFDTQRHQVVVLLQEPQQFIQ